MEIGAHRGEHRLFLIFAASLRGEGFVLQDSLLAGSGEGFVERDLLRGYFFEDGAGSFDGAPVSSEEASRWCAGVSGLSPAASLLCSSARMAR